MATSPQPPALEAEALVRVLFAENGNIDDLLAALTKMADDAADLHEQGPRRSCNSSRTVARCSSRPDTRVSISAGGGNVPLTTAALATVRLMFTVIPHVNTRSIRLVGAAAFVVALAGCGGSSTSLVDEAVEHADATCSCEDFDCTTEHIQWFNKVSITQEDDLDGLGDADRATYLDNSLRAADCQNELR